MWSNPIHSKANDKSNIIENAEIKFWFHESNFNDILDINVLKHNF